MNLFRNMPGMLRYIPIPFAFGALILWFTGVSLFSRPDFELSYSRETLQAPCVKEGCVTILTLRVGNTGKIPQESVRVSVPTSIEEATLNGVTIRNGAKVPQKAETSRSEGVTTYNIERILPGHRIDLAWMFHTASASSRPRWGGFSVQVLARNGKVQEASPEITTFGRFLLQFLDLF